MKQFLKFFFASCLGVLVSMFILLIIFFGIIGALASKSEKAVTIKPNSVIHLKFDRPIPELTNNVELDPFSSIDNQKTLGLSDILHAIEQAKSDDHIKGIFLETEMISTGFATASALRDALEDFRQSGKFIISYSKYYTQGAYFLSSAADEIYLHPLGMVDFRGFSAQVAFFKDVLDRIGVDMQVFYAGKFKSATEPYRRNDMSPENREQLREFLRSMYDYMLAEISDTRGVPTAELHRIADGYLAGEPEAALQYRLIDAVGYRDEALATVRKKLGLDEDAKINFVGLADFFQQTPRHAEAGVKDKIAVVYAEGTILDGKTDPGAIGDENYTSIIDRLRNDDKVKAVVLRINSPGGSAMASESIWRSLTLLKESGKPLIVSMGDYAASGGYYIACLADSIIAQNNTLTGSIGVFNIIPSMQNLLNDKIGIHFDTVKTGRFATGINVFYDMDEAEKKIVQQRTDEMYRIFKRRVAEGRKMSENQVEEIAQGRVWTGKKAVDIGLVDRLGDLNDAVAVAARMGNTDQYRIVEYPKIKEPLLQLIEKLSNDTEARNQFLIRQELGEHYPLYQYLRQIRDSRGAQARLPFLIPFN